MELRMYKFSLRVILCVAVVSVLCSTAQAASSHDGVGHGVQTCLGCHNGMVMPDKTAYLDTKHPKKVRDFADGNSPILTTIINTVEVSIFDSNTEGYATYLAPWANYFNEPNVIYTIGGAGWKQRFMTQKVPTVTGGVPDYNTPTQLTGNDYVVMGIQWNIREQKWQDYHGPAGTKHEWYKDTRLTRKKCGGCHTSGFNPTTGTWFDKNNSLMEKGVTCESCHRSPADPNGGVINPANLTFTQQFELCGSCHGRGSSSGGSYGFPYDETAGRGYGPGDVLSNFYTQSTSSSGFWPNGPNGTNGNSKKHHQQYNDSLLSEHYAFQVGCTDCHTSHTSDNPHQTKLADNNLCTSCHTEKADPNNYRLHSGHYNTVAKCMDCHMPYTAKSINAFDIRSHTFNIIPPSETIAQGGDPNGFSGALDTSHIPNSCNSKCHNGEVGSEGPLKTNAVAQLGLNYIRSLNGTSLDGDVNNDGIVDWRDFADFATDWLHQTDWYQP